MNVITITGTRIEVQYYTNILCLTGMTVSFSMSGDLQKAFSYAFANPHALWLMTIYTFLAYFAISMHMCLVREFGGVTTVRILCCSSSSSSSSSSALYWCGISHYLGRALTFPCPEFFSLPSSYFFFPIKRNETNKSERTTHFVGACW